MQNKAVFLDANVLLEIILGRKNQTQVRKLLDNNKNIYYITALTAHIVVYFGQQVTDLPVLRKFIGDYALLNLSNEDFEWAFNNSRSADFEDALQLAVAIRNGCDSFVTFDKNLFNTYKDLPVIKLELLK